MAPSDPMRFPDELRILGSAAPVADLPTSGASGSSARSIRADAPTAVRDVADVRDRRGNPIAPADTRCAPLRIWPRAW